MDFTTSKIENIMNKIEDRDGENGSSVKRDLSHLDYTG